MSGVVSAVNTELEASPHLVNKSPYDKGWLYKLEISDEEELKSLLSAADYETYLKTSAEDA